ncbi:MAG TPA: SurA N-terminal domain-containing protein [Thermodesulfovibrionales bacterium]|nr:SurA N-terminal domain-containing protein [Thermodesulfovibrionales bacterium]
MLKAMRKHAKFFYVLFFIVILSFIFWGVGTVDKSTNVPVAEIEREKISVEDYWTAYDRARQFYREILKERFDEAMEKQLNLKQKVLASLVDEKVLLIAAQKAGIKVTDEELEDSVMKDPTFQRDGKFNRDVYVRTLQLNRMTPEYFEALKRRELALSKMRRLIGEAVDVTDVYIPQGTPDEQAERMRQSALLEMRDGAVRSYIEGVKKELKVKINQQLIS